MLLKWGLAAVLVMHGFGHVMFAFAAWTNVPVGFTNSPWILPGNVMVRSPIGYLSAVIWLIAVFGFLAAALGLVQGAAWWPSTAVVASILSLAILVLWWNTITPGSRIWAALVDVAIVAALMGPWKAAVLAQLA